MKAKLTPLSILWIALPLTILLLAPAAFSQDEDFEEMEETMTCIPDSLETPHDRFQSDAVDEAQVNLWYDYGRDYFNKAKYGKKNGHFRSAASYFWKVVINDKTGRFKTTYAKIAECYSTTNQPDSTLIAVYRGLKKYPDFATLHYYAGQIHKARGQASCAIPHYEALVELNNQSPEVLKNYWATLAKLYFQTDDERAIEAQQKVADLDPNDLESANFLVQLTEYYGMDPMEAKAAAFVKDTTNIQNARSYGLTAYESGDYQTAQRAFGAILKQDPGNIEARMYIAYAYEGLNNYPAAIKTYKEILNIDPEKPNVHCAIASVYGRTQNFVSARSHVKKAQRIDPKYGYSYMVMGEILENAVAYCSENRGKKNNYTYEDKLVFELARKEYQKAAAKDPNVAVSANNRYKQLEAFVPTTADKHMHNNSSEVKDACYSWINN